MRPCSRVRKTPESCKPPRLLSVQLSGLTTPNLHACPFRTLKWGRGGPMLKDARHAMRMLLHAQGWTAVVVLSLGLGIGATAALFSAVNGMLLTKIPVKDPDTLVRLRYVGKNDMVTSSSDYGFVARGPDGLDVRTTVSPPAVHKVR